MITKDLKKEATARLKKIIYTIQEAATSDIIKRTRL
jgi:hypothetical protein